MRPKLSIRWLSYATKGRITPALIPFSTTAANPRRAWLRLRLRAPRSARVFLHWRHSREQAEQAEQPVRSEQACDRLFLIPVMIFKMTMGMEVLDAVMPVGMIMN